MQDPVALVQGLQPDSPGKGFTMATPRTDGRQPDELRPVSFRRRYTRQTPGSVAAISVGLLNDVELLDLDYSEDKDAEVDLNLVMTGTGEFVEVQGTGEEATFSRSQLDRLLKLGKVGIDAVTAAQRRALGAN